MRFCENAMGRWLAIILASLSVVACGHQTFTQPDPTSANEVFMLNEAAGFTPMLNVGEFIVTFETDNIPVVPDGRQAAGWTSCIPYGNSPWYVHFNKTWINSFGLDETIPGNSGLTGRAYLPLLVGHEMCHVWQMKKTGRCSDEMAAEICANNLVTLGRPE